MEPKDEIDDTAYFKTLRALEEGGPFDGRLGGITKWSIEPDATREGDTWSASVSIMRMGTDAETEEGLFDHFFTMPDLYPSEAEALTAAREFAQDWIAQQPIE
jgi:hypothetical protein